MLLRISIAVETGNSTAKKEMLGSTIQSRPSLVAVTPAREAGIEPRDSHAVADRNIPNLPRFRRIKDA